MTTFVMTRFSLLSAQMAASSRFGESSTSRSHSRLKRRNSLMSFGMFGRNRMRPYSASNDIGSALITFSMR